MKVSLDYMAGFFDGEGCISIQGKHRQVVALISNTYLPILQAFQDRYGGSIYKKKKEKAHHKDAWYWRVHARTDVARFLLDMQPLLIEKQPQADNAMRILLSYLEN